MVINLSLLFRKRSPTFYIALELRSFWDVKSRKQQFKDNNYFCANRFIDFSRQCNTSYLGCSFVSIDIAIKLFLIVAWISVVDDTCNAFIVRQ
ncbi:hypothetical protein NPIL_68611 [Nephila pilipes]|uniref:Uncharacterized protein n=1 Tax=Nephila pilipes TaxID=299642 RepID=A0A8X6T6Z5_NEPPI|nr:hypothetical protein NPIL_68611 [Nephila pilipes]